MGYMSKDRVRFKIGGYKLSASSKESDGYRKLLKDVFNLDCYDKCDYSDIEIICRPSQFARFMIKRHSIGLQNTFSELGATLFTPEPAEKQRVFDVSCEPAR